MHHAQIADAAARQRRQDAEAITVDDLRVSERALAVTKHATQRPAVRQRLRNDNGERLHRLLRTEGATRGLETVGRELVDLFNAGATEPELRLYAGFVSGVIDDLMTGAKAPDYDLALIRYETALDGREDECQHALREAEATGDRVQIERACDALETVAAESAATYAVVVRAVQRRKRQMAGGQLTLAGGR